MQHPKAFDSQHEPVKFLARMKSRAANNFKWTVSRSLEDAMYLAYWCHVFGRDEEALEVCEFLSAFEFAGNYNLWSWIEGSLALHARLLRGRDDPKAAVACTQRIRAAGFVEGRLSGSLLNNYQRNIGAAVNEQDKPRERDWRAVLAKELCTIIELGGSQTLPVQKAELMYQENLAHLQALVAASKP
jgi:hypothetical protein